MSDEIEIHAGLEKTVAAIMAQAQVFASTYSLVGGRFDDGSKMEQSNEEKNELEALVRSALIPASQKDAIAPMRPIPIAAAKRIAKEYGYDQVLIYARRCHDTPEPHGEHMTTYGRNAQHCDVAARIGDTLKKFMGWEA